MIPGCHDVAATADAITSAVRRVPAVADLHAGGLVPVATLLPGRRVDGVQIDDEHVRIAVVAVLGVPLPAIAELVRAAVSPLAGGRRIDVHVADVRPAAQAPRALPPAVGAPPAHPTHQI